MGKLLWLINYISTSKITALLLLDSLMLLDELDSSSNCKENKSEKKKRQPPHFDFHKRQFSGLSIGWHLMWGEWRDRMCVMIFIFFTHVLRY